MGPAWTRGLVHCRFDCRETSTLMTRRPVGRCRCVDATRTAAGAPTAPRPATLAGQGGSGRPGARPAGAREKRARLIRRPDCWTERIPRTLSLSAVRTNNRRSLLVFCCVCVSYSARGPRRVLPAAPVACCREPRGFCVLHGHLFGPLASWHVGAFVCVLSFVRQLPVASSAARRRPGIERARCAPPTPRGMRFHQLPSTVYRVHGLRVPARHGSDVVSDRAVSF